MCGFRRDISRPARPPRPWNSPSPKPASMGRGLASHRESETKTASPSRARNVPPGTTPSPSLILSQSRLRRPSSVVSHKSLAFRCSNENPWATREDGACPTLDCRMTDEPRSPGASLEPPEGMQVFSRPTSLLAPHRPPRVCSSLAPLGPSKALAAKHPPFLRHDTSASPGSDSPMGSLLAPPGGPRPTPRIHRIPCDPGRGESSSNPRQAFLIPG